MSLDEYLYEPIFGATRSGQRRVRCRPARAALVALLLATAACSSSAGKGTNNRDAGEDAADSDTSGTALRFTFQSEILDERSAGIHTKIASRDGRTAIAYFRDTGRTTVDCPASTFGEGGNKPRPSQMLSYTAFENGAWLPAEDVVQTFGPTQGLSLLIDAQGATHLGYLGGILSKAECSSSDAMIATREKGGSTFSERTLMSGGSGRLGGDTTGYWMSLARDCEGTIRATHRGVHFGYRENIGDNNADWLYEDGELIIADAGEGLYTSLLFDPSSCLPVAVAYDPFRSEINLAVRKKAGEIAEQTDDTASKWNISIIASAPTTEAPSFTRSSTGNYGLAFYNKSTTKQILEYSESDNLETWSAPISVDFSATVHGSFPSLAYDSQGNPGISYYRCARAGGTGCQPEEDALMFAYRANGVWKTWEVDSGDERLCGTYTSLSFTADDEPLIAYRCTVIDQGTDEKFIQALKVARGRRE